MTLEIFLYKINVKIHTITFFVKLNGSTPHKTRDHPASVILELDAVAIPITASSPNALV
jgi:hypothetical protein